MCLICFSNIAQEIEKSQKNELALLFIWPFLHAKLRRFDHSKSGRKQYEKKAQTN